MPLLSPRLALKSASAGTWGNLLSGFGGFHMDGIAVYQELTVAYLFLPCGA